jgi:hypothetical protein
MPPENITPDPIPNGPSAWPPGATAPPAGLPPVAPPSGKLMLQLFLVPGLIVAFLVVAWLVGGWLFGVSYSKKDFLDKLKDPNPEVRWRAAEHLAQVLLRDDALAQDGDFARQLAVTLEKTRDDARQAEEEYAAREPKLTKEEAQAERLKLAPNRNFISYLSAALGNFMVPVGAPVLKDLAVRKEGIDPKTRALRRRLAVWTLANLGENLKRFDRLDDPHKAAVLDRLRVALWDAGQDGGDRDAFLKMSAGDKDAALDKLNLAARPGHADWLRDALRALRNRAAGKDDDMGVGDALVACAGEKDDPYLRELSAFAMNFLRGDEAANRRMQQALVALTNDNGEGEDRLADLADEKEETPMQDALSALTGGGDQGTTAVSKIPGLQIRFNAAVALARFGGKDARIDVLKDMLDENYLRTNLVLRPRNGGQEQPNEEVIGQTLTNALKAVAELHRLRPDANLSSLKPSIDALAGSANPDVRTEAEKTRLALRQ